MTTKPSSRTGLNPWNKFKPFWSTCSIYDLWCHHFNKCLFLSPALLYFVAVWCRLLYVYPSRLKLTLVLAPSYECPSASERVLGLYSLSGRITYRKISWILKAVKLGFKLFQTALKFERPHSNSAVEMPVKFQSDMIIMISNLTALRLREIWRQDFLSLSEERPLRIYADDSQKSSRIIIWPKRYWITEGIVCRFEAMVYTTSIQISKLAPAKG